MIGRIERIAKSGPQVIYETATAAATDQVPPRFSEEALALRFSARHGNDLRYVAAWGKWFRWDGMRWCEDCTLRVFDLARAICREAAAECESEKPSAVLGLQQRPRWLRLNGWPVLIGAMPPQ